MRMTIGKLRQVIREEVARSLREGGSVYDNSGRGPNPSARPHGLPNDEDMGFKPRQSGRTPTKDQVAAEIGMDPAGIGRIDVLPDGAVHVVTVDGEYMKEPGDRFREI